MKTQEEVGGRRPRIRHKWNSQQEDTVRRQKSQSKRRRKKVKEETKRRKKERKRRKKERKRRKKEQTGEGRSSKMKIVVGRQ